MARIGVVSIPAPGHFYSVGALAKRIRSRGHEVVYFEVPDFESRANAAGLDFRPIGGRAYPPGAVREQDEMLGRLKGIEAFRFTIRRIINYSNMVLDDLPAAAREEKVEALVVDQCQAAGGAVADLLGVPYVGVASALPINFDASVAPFQFAWPHRRDLAGRMRNRAANWLIRRLVTPIAATVDDRRRAWGLPPIEWGPEAFSKLLQVAQLPAALELPGRALPPCFRHTGPWTDPDMRATPDFPWDRLDPGRPLAYVSMGTLQNQIAATFRAIAEACAGTGLQLVISMGGGGDPARLGDLPGDPVVVGFAPQLDLIRRATLTISHGGLNTTLESLASGVPTVVIPVTNDQPGVGVRVEAAGVGRSIPVARATVPRLRQAIRAVLDDPSYRRNAQAVAASIEAADGLSRAADLILEAFGFATRQKEEAR